jgi:hypothetical protein
MNPNNKLNFNESFNQGHNLNEHNFQESFLPEITYENDNIIATHNSTGEERFFINPPNPDNFRNIMNKRQRTEKKGKNTHSKFTYNNLKRESKHLVIENVMDFINKKIEIVYDGKIGDGLFKKQLLKLNQDQKKNSNAEFNQLFLSRTLKEILSENITKRIKFYNEDHNKKLIEQLIEEKRDEFESLFNLTFLDCLEHFTGKKKVEELDRLTLFSELKDSILEKYKTDGESYYNNLELFMKEFQRKINNSKPRKRKEQKYEDLLDIL